MIEYFMKSQNLIVEKKKKKKKKASTLQKKKKTKSKLNQKLGLENMVLVTIASTKGSLQIVS